MLRFLKHRIQKKNGFLHLFHKTTEKHHNLPSDFDLAMKNT